MIFECALNIDKLDFFSKIIRQEVFDNDLFTSLPIIIVACDFSPSLFNKKRGALPPLRKITILT